MTMFSARAVTLVISDTYLLIYLLTSAWRSAQWGRTGFHGARSHVRVVSDHSHLKFHTLCPIHTADATQLSSWVALSSAVCIVFYTHWLMTSLVSRDPVQVSRAEYMDCNIHDDSETIMMLNCSNPRHRKRFTILFEPFQSIPNVPEYHAGGSYYFISQYLYSSVVTLASIPPEMPGTHPHYFGWGGRQWEYPPILLRTVLSDNISRPPSAQPQADLVRMLQCYSFWIKENFKFSTSEFTKISQSKSPNKKNSEERNTWSHLHLIPVGASSLLQPWTRVDATVSSSSSANK